jgi:UvrB/uvrC motif
MSRPRDIDSILRNWDYEPGEVNARLVRAADGRQVVQLRVDLGLLQLEVDDRPDGTRPGGSSTYFEHLRETARKGGADFVLSDEQCVEVDREFVQFYQRRICWLALREFRRAVRDADHSLAFMDFVGQVSPNDDWTHSHEQYRGYVVFHRTQAAALAELEEHGPERAIEEISAGLERLRQLCESYEEGESSTDQELLDRLNELRESLREHYRIDRTLSERLAEAVRNEQYELAAEIRDEMARRTV